MTKSEIYLNNLYCYLIRKYGTDSANRDIQDIQWYINTGRASTEFMRKLYNVKIFVIARILHKGGSTEEVINRIKKTICKAS